VDGNFEGGTKVFGLAEDGVGISPYHEFDSVVPQEVKDAVEKAKKDILSGAVKVEATRAAIGR